MAQQQQQKIPRNAAMRQAEAGGFVDIEGMLARVPPMWVELPCRTIRC